MAEAAWKEAMKHSMELDEEDENEADGTDADREYTHYDLFKQLKRNTKLSRVMRARSGGNATSGTEKSEKPVTQLEFSASTSAAGGNNNTQTVSHNPNTMLMEEEEDYDYEAPVYATPLQTAPPPPRSLFGVPASGVGPPASTGRVSNGGISGGQRRGNNKASRMKKRNSGINNSSGVGSGTTTPKKSSSTAATTASATITNTTLAVDSPTHTQAVVLSPNSKSDPKEASGSTGVTVSAGELGGVDAAIENANMLLADIELSISGGGLDGSGSVPAQDRIRTQMQKPESTLQVSIPPSKPEEVTSTGGKDTGQEILLSDEDDDDETDSEDERKLDMYNRHYDMVEAVVSRVVMEEQQLQDKEYDHVAGVSTVSTAVLQKVGGGTLTSR